MEEKWTQKYNSFGHVSWNGRIYGNGLTLPVKAEEEKIFYGVWGTALFQSIYQPSAGLFASILLMPEWYFIVAGLAGLSLLGFLWQPLFFAFPLLIASVVIGFVQAGTSAAKAIYATVPKNDFEKYYRWGLTTFLHIIQPLARLSGRLQYDWSSERKKEFDYFPSEFAAPKKRYFSIWSETWKSTEDWLRSIEFNLIKSKTKVRRGGEFDRYDLETNIGMFAFCRGLIVIEEHGAGKQLVRLQIWVRYSMFALIPFIVLAALALLAAFDNAFAAAVILSAFSIVIGVSMLRDAARATRNLSLAFLDLNQVEITETEEDAVDLAPSLEPAKRFVAAAGADKKTKTVSENLPKARN